MSGLFKTRAPDSSFSLGDDEDASLGEPDHQIVGWKAQPAAKEAVDPGQHSLGNGSTHTSNGHPPPAGGHSSQPSSHAEAGKHENGAPAASGSAAPPAAEPAQELNGKDQPPAAQQNPAGSSAPVNTDAASAAVRGSGPHADSPAPPAADARASKDEDDEDRIAQACTPLMSCRLLIPWQVGSIQHQGSGATVQDTVCMHERLHAAAGAGAGSPGG